VIWYQLTRPLAFWTINHPQLRWVTIWLPVALTISAVIIFLLLPIEPKVLGEKSLTQYVLIFISTLPGFYIAALAAVATFDRPTLDEIMPPPAPTMKLRTGLFSESVELTMRMFLSHMFAYLTTISFFTAALCIAAELIAPSVQFWITKMPTGWLMHFVHMALKISYLSLLIWLISIIGITTLHGMYFLAERIHRPNA
jgi:hypothetical protein